MTHRLHGWNLIKKAIMMMSKTARGIVSIIIIVASLGLFSAFWSSWSVLIPLLAIIGGLIVFLGLWIEKEAENEGKKEHLNSFVDTFRCIKLKSKIGWWVLMVGIGIEVL